MFRLQENIKTTLKTIASRYHKNKIQFRFCLLEFLYYGKIFTNETLFKKIIDVLNNESIIHIYYWYLQFCYVSNVTKLILKRSDLFKRFSYEYFNPISKTWLTHEDISFSNTCIKKIESSHRNDDHMMVLFWLYVATTDKTTLKSLDAEKRIDYFLLELIDPTLPIKFRHWLNLKGDEPLRHLLFDINQVKGMKTYYQTFQKFDHWK